MYRFQGKHATKKSSIQSYLQKIHSQSHFSSIFHPARAAWRCPARAPPAPRCVPRCRAHPSCGIAVRTPRAPLRAHRPCPVAVGRDVPIAPPRHRRGARLGIPHLCRAPSPPRCAAWHRAHAESIACRGSVRGTVRGRAAHPARCHDRAAIYPRAIFARAFMHGHGAMRRDGDIAPYRHYARMVRTAIFARHYAPPERTQNSHAHRLRWLTAAHRPRWLTAAHRPWR